MSLRVLMMVPDCFMVDRRVLQQARSLVGAGYRVTLLAGFECAQEESHVWEGIPIHRYRYDWDDERLKRLRARLPNHDRLRMWVNRAWMKLAPRLLSLSPFDTFVLAKARQFDADVVHVHDLPLLKHGALRARELGARLVFDAHEIYYEQEVLPPRARRRLRAQERRYVPACDLFTTVNDAIADYFERLHGVRPLVLFNAADRPPAGFDRDSRADLRRRAGLPPDARVVLYQGWISGERNLEPLVRSAAALPADAYLVLIGYGDFEAELKRLVEPHPWRERVRFLGRVEPAEILNLTAGADLGVIPYLPIDLNHRLCSPNKFFEYVQAGVPIVAHDLAFFRDMGQRYGVVETADLASDRGMAGAVTGMLSQPEKLERMRSACRAAAETLHWETEARKLLAAYERLKRN